MLYKNINEKYERIFNEGLKEKKREEENITNEADMKASQKYNSNKKSVDVAMKELMNLIKKHESDFKKDGETNWGMVGDMARLKTNLLDILEYMKPMKPKSKDIEWIEKKGKDIFRKMGR
jgi:ribosomal protein S17E